MTPQNINALTIEDYIEYADIHIRYELDMLIGSASLCEANAPIEGNLINFTLHNAVIESFGIHARSLISFLYPNESNLKPDDITIFNYVSAKDIAEHRPLISDILKGARIQANKQVAHLTSQRLFDYRSIENHIWNYRDIAVEIMTVFNMLAPYFDSNKIMDDVRSYLESEMSIYLFDVSWDDSSTRIGYKLIERNDDST